MSALVDGAIGRAGLSPVLEARRAGVMTADHVEMLRRADLLVLGALADRVRADEVGDEVRIFTSPPAGDDSACVLPGEGRALNGLELLREVAMARLTGPRGVRVRVDWSRCGLEIAQVALGFGANELVGRMANKRGLPLAEGEVLGVGKRSRLELAELVKRRELEGFVRRAGRTPAFAPEVG